MRPTGASNYTPGLRRPSLETDRTSSKQVYLEVSLWGGGLRIPTAGGVGHDPTARLIPLYHNLAGIPGRVRVYSDILDRC